jgi:flagellar biosynthesis chaperone FliJ
MELKSERELQNTREKLKRLEELYDETSRDASEDEFIREATLRSLKRFINQLKEEIARFEAHHTVRQ